MDIVFKLLLWVHLVSLTLGGLASFGLPIISRAVRTADPAAKPPLIALRSKVSNLGLMALASLVITGPLMLFVGTDKPLGFWFGLKMAAVVALAGVILYSRENAGRAATGDEAAMARAPMLSRVSTSLLMLTILLAAFAFG